MLCPTCGEKVLFIDGTFLCETCDTEYDMLDTDEYLIPEPFFVSVGLLSQYAIIDTRKQKVYVSVDTIQKARLLTELLNWHFSKKTVKRQLANYLNHK
jgi:predicted amidophosphoribosyltransferase